MADLTHEEITIIKSRLPFWDVEPTGERFQMIADFMRDAERLYMQGPISFLNHITATDDNGKEVEVIYEEGDLSVGIPSGWVIDGIVQQGT